MRNKVAGLFFVALLSLVGGLRAEDNNPNNIPSDTPENFTERYRYFLESRDKKPFKPILKQLKKINDRYKKPVKALEKKYRDLNGEQGATNEAKAVAAELDVLIAKRESEKASLLAQMSELIAAFWKEHDYKEIIDERLEDIAAERFFTTSETPGLRFSNHGGFNGGMAQVYILHGEPNIRSELGRTSLFVDMMLWIYQDQENGEVRYAFLFYKRGGGSFYELFPQDSYQMEPCRAISEVLMHPDFGYQGCTSQIQQAYLELQRSVAVDGTPGYAYAWALLNFSQDSTIRQGEALSPPLAASVVAKRAGSRVVGEVPIPEDPASVIEVVRGVCATCESMIPAELSLENGISVSVKRGQLDWVFIGEEVQGGFSVRIVLESAAGDKPLVFAKTAKINSRADMVKSDPGGVMNIQFLSSEEFATVPPGEYNASIYLKSSLTNRYQAWEVLYVKK